METCDAFVQTSSRAMADSAAGLRRYRRGVAVLWLGSAAHSYSLSNVMSYAGYLAVDCRWVDGSSYEVEPTYSSLCALSLWTPLLPQVTTTILVGQAE